MSEKQTYHRQSVSVKLAADKPKLRLCALMHGQPPQSAKVLARKAGRTVGRKTIVAANHLALMAKRGHAEAAGQDTEGRTLYSLTPAGEAWWRGYEKESPAAQWAKSHGAHVNSQLPFGLTRERIEAIDREWGP